MVRKDWFGGCSVCCSQSMWHCSIKVCTTSKDDYKGWGHQLGQSLSQPSSVATSKHHKNCLWCSGAPNVKGVFTFSILQEMHFCSGYNIICVCVCVCGVTPPAERVSRAAQPFPHHLLHPADPAWRSTSASFSLLHLTERQKDKVMSEQKIRMRIIQCKTLL